MRALAPAGESLFFTRPEKSHQKKGRPVLAPREPRAVPCATRHRARSIDRPAVACR